MPARPAAALTAVGLLVVMTTPAEARVEKQVPCWQRMKDLRMVVEPRHARPGRYRVLRYDMMKDHNLSTSGRCLIEVW